ncbi:GyrI-like domain-containing protein [Providencia heimbachae]|uniref:AraC effector-binding domain-containing protein n=1 Tax=Providencia heimbachae ATCC 35613 TaxID=1354272 RepID=A0A1B7JLN2_9GAMM|nr:effector binding domain-containing protein [Providencia heimbachae]OAT48843.1 hypothetical protein M998_3202 [Providencia heimbachae ATCC 35613]SQH12422.1 Bacterial transcription activator, effector binding domain [Providencia heimbachae]
MFTYSIIELPERTVAGISVETDMQKAIVDCPALWQKFVPLFLSLQKKNKADLEVESFGVSRMLDENRFIYKAVVEVTDEMITDGLIKSVLPKTLYLQTTVPHLSKLTDAYQDIYGRWANEQKEYGLNYMEAALEVYPVNFCDKEYFTLLVPIIKK